MCKGKWGERNEEKLIREDTFARAKPGLIRFRIRSHSNIEQVEPVPGEVWDVEVYDNVSSALGIAISGLAGGKVQIGALRLENAR